jgi:hypothetical protein
VAEGVVERRGAVPDALHRSRAAPRDNAGNNGCKQHQLADREAEHERLLHFWTHRICEPSPDVRQNNDSGRYRRRPSKSLNNKYELAVVPVLSGPPARPQDRRAQGQHD